MITPEEITFEKIEREASAICRDLMELINTPGPSHSVAKMACPDTRIKGELPMVETVRRIIQRMNKQDGTKIDLIEDHGNIVLVGGLNSKKTALDEIRNIQVVLGAHLDEITYLISKKSYDNSSILLPLCSAPTRTYAAKGHPFIHEEARILGYRNRELITLGYGRFHAVPKFTVEKRTKEKKFTGWDYLLKMDKKFHEIKPGDIAIQNYGTTSGEQVQYNANSIINAKALDDRVGSIVVIYAVRYLSKLNPPIPIKAILAGDEEGFGVDVSWARLIKPTFERFCKNNVITIICDGINGSDLVEFEKERKGELLTEALLLPYTSYGKGAGDYSLFSIIRDEVIPHAEVDGGFQVQITTDYASRSFDPKIMDEFPLVTFLDWSNGKVGDLFARCHMDESIKVKQILNLIGTMVYTVEHLALAPDK